MIFRRNMGMQEYEMVFEIFNQCSGNIMRDVFFEEKEFADEAQIDSFVKSRHTDANLTIEKTYLDKGVIIYDVCVSGLPHRYTFTPV